MKLFFNRLIPKGRIGRSVLILMSGTAAAQALTALSLPIVTRLYTPEMIGVISIYLSFFNFWNSTLTWRYEGALLISVDEDESHQIFRIGAFLVILMSLLAIPAMYVLQRYEIFGFSELPTWSPAVVFLSLIGFGWFMMYRSWALRLQTIRDISIATISRTAANATTRILSGVTVGHISGLFIAEILGSWFALLSLRNSVKAKLMSKPIWNIANFVNVALKYKKFATYELPSTIVNQLAIALPVPMVAALYGAQAAGWFGLARLLYAIPNTQIGKSVGDVFQIELGKCVRQAELQKGLILFRKFTLRLLLVGIIVLVTAVTLAPTIAPIVFGSEWAQMGTIVAYMAPWMCASLVVSSMSRTLSVIQKQEWKLMYDFTYLAIVTLVFIWSKYSAIELMNFIKVLSFSMVAAYTIYFIIIYQVLSVAASKSD